MPFWKVMYWRVRIWLAIGEIKRLAPTIQYDPCSRLATVEDALAVFKEYSSVYIDVLETTEAEGEYIETLFRGVWDAQNSSKILER